MAGNVSEECGQDGENIIVNARDGLPNVHPNILQMDNRMDSSDDSSQNDELSDLPTSLIVTNIHDNIFVDKDKKTRVEELFRRYDVDVTFQWLRSFRRLRVNFCSAQAAVSARLHLHQYRIEGSTIACYFAQPVTPVKRANLQPPAPTKQYLISPPSSPPVDWQPREENEPLINHDLLAALATLAPGQTHELHPPAPGQPSIVVHTALATCSNNS